jgi:hypothetical protein
MDFHIDFDSKSWDFEAFKSNESIAIGVTVISVLLALILFWPSAEAAVDYSVEIPEPCQKDWSGPVLEKPSIHVCPPFWVMPS